MMQNLTSISLIFLILLSCSPGSNKSGEKSSNEQGVMEKALELAQELMIVDTHIDLPYWLLDNEADLSKRLDVGHIDLPRAKKGGLNVPFMSIYIPANKQEVGVAKLFADSLIDIVEGITNQWPENFGIPFSTQDVKDQVEQGLISLPMGMENGLA